MPYVEQERREKLDPQVVYLASIVEDSGELNYVITRLLLMSLKSGRYSDFNALIGVLECVKQEFYRRAVAPYEDKMKEKRGDVFP